ncbi:hypothetical protein [Pedobacter sp. ASV12]|uniref:hypothetical protein n=1 Tax=Pedobacter sp. ASV12 TaxID=2795120 RepID=UPI0018EC1DDD|nr:hypothetical protein [Pedobacter sp. ASV12]
MTVINADIFNVYIRSSVSTNRYVKVLFTLFNLGAFVTLLWLAISMQKDGPAPLIFLLPLIYFFSLGKYLIWNIFGEEIIIVNVTHVSYQHSYGLWKTKLKTEKYSLIEAWPVDETQTEEDVKLWFGSYQKETKLRETVFQSTIAIKASEWLSVYNLLSEIQLDEFSVEKGFPKIYSN